jgi:NADPH2:quinone reductase
VARAIVLKEYGGPEQLQLDEVEVGQPGEGEVLIRHTGIGVNYIDTYFRRGVYPIPLPAVIGDQACGVVEALGSGVSEFKRGDRVGYGSSARAYIEKRVIKTKDIVRLPDGISDEVVAATLLRGMTAEYLLFRAYELKPGETALVHAATGGTGLIVCQWAKALGATVIASVGAASKFAAATAAGADHVLLHNAADFVEQVRAMTAGRGVDVAYDSVGRDTFMNSIACLRPRGMMVAYGNASGKPEPFDVLTLAAHGSLFLTRPRLNEYIATKDELELSASRFFAALEQRIVRPHDVERFDLADAAAAHIHLEDRAKFTIPILIP